MAPSSTYAPTLTYIGGMQTTPGATYAPSRMLDPPGTGLLLNRHERQAEVLLHEAERGQRGLDRSGVRLDEIRLHEGEQAVVQGARSRPVTAQGKVGESRHRVGHLVRRHRHDAVGAQRDER